MAYAGDCTLLEFACEQDRDAIIEAKKIYLSMPLLLVEGGVQALEL